MTIFCLDVLMTTMIATIQDRAVGFVKVKQRAWVLPVMLLVENLIFSLTCSPSKLRHGAELSMGVHPSYQRKKIKVTDIGKGFLVEKVS